MIVLKNVLEFINELLVIPIAIITMVLLMYIAVYLWKKDPDIIRSRIFLKYREFKKAFVLLALFAFVLVLHVLFIYIPHIFLFYSPLITDMQRIFGLVLVLVMLNFAYVIFRSISE
jgi:hypothetical protein